MIAWRRGAIAVVAAVCCVLSASAQRLPAIADIQDRFADPPADSRIMMRWWWFGPSVTRDEIAAEMRRMKEGGIGGFEIATVYPLAVDDRSSGLRNYPFLSPEYLDAIAFTAREARSLGLRMDLTIGSGWSYGGPYITPELAATRIRSDRREIAPGVSRVERPHPYEHDRLVAAFVGRGSAQEVDPSTYREVAIADRGPLALPPGDGPRVLLLYYASPTGQVVKRAAVGAEGYMLDHYSRAALQAHLREAGDKLLAAAGPGAVQAVFCDSLEVYDADWTTDLLSEFQRRRGYDLRPLLPIAEFANGDRADAIRRDYGRTLTELYTERFAGAMRDWTSRHGVQFRMQNYGMPPASLASHEQIDIADGEGFEWRTLSASRWAASAAHLFGKQVVSSETWTWLHSPAFRATPLDLKAEADLHFLSGVNQLIGHGWPYSPPQAGSPGWMFYAAGAYSDKNPWWPVMPDLARYLQRVSFVLRQGEPEAEVALYAPTEDAWALFRPGNPRNLNLFTTIRELIGPRIVPAILDSGHPFDVIDDGTLKYAGGYSAVVVPPLKHMPEATRRWLDQYSAGGGRVLSAESVTAGGLAEIPPDVVVHDPAIGFIHRRLADAEVYFVVNTGNTAKQVRATFRDAGPNPEIWDPMTGQIHAAATDGGALTLAFEPYGSMFVVFRGGGSHAVRITSRHTIESRDLRSGWTVNFDGGRSAGMIDLPYSWDSAAATRFFSGAAAFRRTVDLPDAASGARTVLDFGEGVAVDREALPGGTMRGNSFAALLAAPIREAATVFVNGRRAGSVWAPPYRLDVTEFVHRGTNELRIEVYNTAINRLAEGGHLPDVAAVTEKYGQRFRLQDLDNLQPIPSGILGVPRLIVER